jgi:hypothetical protein
VISAFRHIALGGSPRQLHGWARLASYVAKTGALLTVLVFFADTINADILYAAIIGDVQFQDNPLILDSATDATSVIPAQFVHANYFALAKFDSPQSKHMSQPGTHHFYGTTIQEDEDSPTVLDGATTATLTFSIRSYDPSPMPELHSTRYALDRTTRFGVMLI